MGVRKPILCRISCGQLCNSNAVVFDVLRKWSTRTITDLAHPGIPIVHNSLPRFTVDLRTNLRFLVTIKSHRIRNFPLSPSLFAQSSSACPRQGIENAYPRRGNADQRYQWRVTGRQLSTPRPKTWTVFVCETRLAWPSSNTVAYPYEASTYPTRTPSFGSRPKFPGDVSHFTNLRQSSLRVLPRR